MIQNTSVLVFAICDGLVTYLRCLGTNLLWWGLIVSGSVLLWLCLSVTWLCVCSASVQLFGLQTDSREHKDGDEMVHHKLPVYVQNMDRLGDTEL